MDAWWLFPFDGYKELQRPPLITMTGSQLSKESVLILDTQ